MFPNMFNHAKYFAEADDHINAVILIIRRISIEDGSIMALVTDHISGTVMVIAFKHDDTVTAGVDRL